MELATAFIQVLSGAGPVEMLDQIQLRRLQTELSRARDEGAQIFELPLSGIDFAIYVGARAASADALPDMALLDLYLACGCSQGHLRAQEEFVRRFRTDMVQALKQLPDALEQADEICQSIFDQLLVADGDGSRGIEGYKGRGSLFSWLRVVAIRRGLRELRRLGKAQPIEEEQLIDEIAQGPDLSYMKELYRDSFRQAFARSLDELDRETRALLRHHYLHGLSIDKLATLHEVHRATAARRIARAREQLLQGTRRKMMGSLRITSEELDSIMAIIDSKLDASLGALMSSSEG